MDSSYSDDPEINRRKSSRQQVTERLFSRDTVIGVFADRHSAARAGLFLQVAGFADDDFTILHGEDGLREVHTIQNTRGVFRRALLAWNDLWLDRGTRRRYYERPLWDGKSTVIVACSEGDRREEIADILRYAGGGRIMYINFWISEEL